VGPRLRAELGGELARQSDGAGPPGGAAGGLQRPSASAHEPRALKGVPREIAAALGLHGEDEDDADVEDVVVGVRREESDSHKEDRDLDEDEEDEIRRNL